ncbi:acyltransferase [Mucilaginibacter sp. CSA2-8R]|uniref:acyltransferase n=1 Tax=Mucilaginibacter sp. CSA2-8R TaxID=3141542 RepID=UPI00315D0771
MATDKKNSLLKVFFKAGYILRKKIEGYKLRYRFHETQYLFGDRISLPAHYYFPKFPEFNFDFSASKIIIHEGVACRGGLNFVFNNNSLIEVGENTYFNNNCSVNALESVQIGSNCLFGEGVKVYDHNHQFRQEGVLTKDQGYSTAAVKIGDNCWLGSNVVVLKGVVIGDNCVIGANCTVYQNVPANSVLVNGSKNTIKQYA